LLSTVEVTPTPIVLWSVQYEQHPDEASSSTPVSTDGHVLNFPPTSMDLAFDDSILDNVREVWQKITGDDAREFLVFQDREVEADDDE
jgi:hypothetical protein